VEGKGDLCHVETAPYDQLGEEEILIGKKKLVVNGRKKSREIYGVVRARIS